MSELTAVSSTSSRALGAEGSELLPNEERARTQHVAQVPRPRGALLSNPLRIGQIGADHIQVFIRPVHGDAELLALVNRLEQLIDAGYETVNVILESAPRDLSAVTDALRGAGSP